jgi:hypothetical protein
VPWVWSARYFRQHTRLRPAAKQQTFAPDRTPGKAATDSGLIANERLTRDEQRWDIHCEELVKNSQIPVLKPGNTGICILRQKPGLAREFQAAGRWGQGLLF